MTKARDIATIYTNANTANEFTKLDPTLPRTQNIKCPNRSCPSNHKSETGEEAKNEVIYLRYDDVNLNYVYICTQCDTIWKTNE